MKFYGFDGTGQKTLEAVGQEFALTKERIRQIIAKMRDQFPQRVKLSSLPASMEALDVLEEKIPCLVEDAQEALFAAGLTAKSFDMSGIVSLFEFDGEAAPFEIVELEGGAQLLTPLGTGQFVGSINSKAGKLVSRWGVTTVSEVCSQIDTRIAPDLVREILGGSPDVVWLDDKRNWFTLTAQKRNRLLNLIKKVLSVAYTIDVTALRKAVSRNHRMKGFAPTRNVLANFCNAQSDILIEGNLVKSRGEVAYEQKLGGIEQSFFDIFTRIGPVARREEIEEECMKIGMNRNSLYVYLSYSPIVERLAKGVYGLIGSSYTLADVEALTDKARGRVLIDHGWTSAGAIWTAFHLNSANIRSGIFNIPKSVSIYVPDGTYEMSAGDELLEPMKVRGGVIWGADKIFERRGGDAGDIFVVELNGGRKTGAFEIGGLDLLDRYSDEHIRQATTSASVEALSST